MLGRSRSLYNSRFPNKQRLASYLQLMDVPAALKSNGTIDGVAGSKSHAQHPSVARPVKETEKISCEA